MAGDTTITHEQAQLAVRVTAFWANVDRGEPDNCWPWTGYAEDGYGRFCIDGRMVGAHELALTFTTGERRLPRLDTCHRCGNPICCNPGHLRFDTRKSNVDDTIRMGRARRFRRLNDDAIRTIRERRHAGAAQEDLAAQFGVSASYVSTIVNGLARIEAGGPIGTKRQYARRS